MKGVKIYSPFSPITHSRLVGFHNKARKFDDNSSSKRSGVLLKSHFGRSDHDVSD